MNSELCDKLAAMGGAVLGLVTCPADGGAQLLAASTATLTVPGVAGQLLHAPANATTELSGRLERKWRGWLREAGYADQAELDLAFEALRDSVHLIDPDVSELMRLGNDFAALADAVCTRAVSQFGAHFSVERNGAQAEKNQAILKVLVYRTLHSLNDNETDRNAVTHWFRFEVLGRLERMEAGQTRQEAKIDRMLAMMEAQGETARAHEAGVSDAQLISLAQRVSEDVEDADQAFRELERAVDIAIQVQEEGARGSNLGAFVDEVLKRVAALSAEGAYDKAADAAGAAFARWQHDEAERQDAARQQGVRLLDAGIRQDLLRRDAASAARRLAQKCDLETPNAATRFEALRMLWIEWYESGRDKGLNLDLEVAIELTRTTVERANDADERGKALNDLGIALQALGSRETSTARLEEAVATFRLVLEERTRERVPLSWAAAQNNLGIALAELGSRDSGRVRLEEAVAAYRLVLEEWTRERVPLDWAMTQNNLGNALRLLGSRETGTARLAEAVAAYRLALEEKPRDLVPLSWAATQINLGNALLKWGEKEDGTVRIEQGLEAYLLCLEERPREELPFLWAETQENLAIAYGVMFERTAARDWLDEALVAVDGALKVYREAEATFHLEQAEPLREGILDKLAAEG